ncbi:MAG: hypothetical protein IPM29_03705 [Planctomycetes bacterium]|nr:hypothetical protein [Planctomycetota bacterium]
MRSLATIVLGVGCLAGLALVARFATSAAETSSARPVGTTDGAQQVGSAARRVMGPEIVAAQAGNLDSVPDGVVSEAHANALVGRADAAGVWSVHSSVDRGGLQWPVTRVRQAAHATGATTANVEPEVPVRIAFRALWYLGVDPEAERTWSRAINDPNSPPGVRSDLIVDMVDEGYSDNSHPTAVDLPTILARLEILERHAPYAMDEVNRVAFENAYGSLLEMYRRLGGTQR